MVLQPFAVSRLKGIPKGEGRAKGEKDKEQCACPTNSQGLGKGDLELRKDGAFTPGCRVGECPNEPPISVRRLEIIPLGKPRTHPRPRETKEEVSERRKEKSHSKNLG